MTSKFTRLALRAVADFGAQNLKYTIKVDGRQNVHLTDLPQKEYVLKIEKNSNFKTY